LPALATAFVALLAQLPLAATASPATDDILVESVKGEVEIKMGGGARAAEAGTKLDLPASLRTGDDGSADLRQGETTIGVAPNTLLEFPAPADGGAFERIAQPRGNAFYDVSPREGRRFRVETPYLVAVIKGTQFNVAVEADRSTISLFEGRLQVLATDCDAVVELKAGEIATRRRGQATIEVTMLDMPNPAGATPTSQASASGSGLDASDPAGSVADLLPRDLPTGDDGGLQPDPTDPVAAADPVDQSLDLGDVIGAELGDTGVGIETGIDLGAGELAAELDAGIDLGGAGIGASASADVDLGAVGVDAGIDLGADLGAGAIDAGIDVGADLGAGSVDVGVDAGADLGAGTVDAGIDAGADLGGIGVDAGIDAGADLGAGTVDAGVDVGAGVGGVEVDAGVDVGADLGAGEVDAGVDVGLPGTGVGVDVGIDLSGDDAGIDLGIDLGLGGNPPAEDGGERESGGLLGLGGILRGRGIL
jgi:FecR protein